MRKSLIALSAAAMMIAGVGSSSALPMNGGLTEAIHNIDLTQKAAVYVVDGRRYCFYFEGWRGPGWYRCGFAWRRGLGWGGVYGWRSWTYGPAERRFGRSGVTVRSGSSTRVREGRRVREETTVRGRESSTHRGATSRGTSESTRRSGTTVRGTRETTTRRGANIRGTRETTTRGGATVRGGQSSQPSRATTTGGPPRGGAGGARSGGESRGQQMNAGPRGNRGATGDRQ
jgi:hypothetical protein